MYRVNPTTEQQRLLINKVSDEIHRLNKNDKPLEFVFNDCQFIRGLFRMYQDCKEIFEATDASELSENIWELFNRAVFDRTSDNVSSYETPQNKDELPERLTVSRSFVSKYFFYASLTSKFLIQMQSHFDFVRLSAEPK